jgi:general secretion pathway protein A
MYCEFYQLTERPFNVTPDPKFLYLNARYREAIASLNYGITQRKGFITLIGEAGTGKTTLLNKLLEDLDSKTKSVFIFNTNVTFEEILEYIFAEFDLPVHNGKKLYMLQRLNAFLLEELRKGVNVALLIDEAQDLEFSVLEDLRLLSNLETAKEKILQIVLSGQPELGQKLSNPVLRQLRQRIGINCRLLPLSHDEITEYIQYRLQAAGCPDLKLFSREAEEQIYHFSRGIPRLVNVVCDNALVIGYALGKKRIGADVISEAAADLLSVETPTQDVPERLAPVVAPAPPVTQSRWRARFGVVSLVMVAIVVGLLSVGRTMLQKRGAEHDGAFSEPAPRLEVIRPGSQPQGTGVDAPLRRPSDSANVVAVEPDARELPEAAEPANKIAPAESNPGAAAALLAKGSGAAEVNAPVVPPIVSWEHAAKTDEPHPAARVEERRAIEPPALVPPVQAPPVAGGAERRPPVPEPMRVAAPTLKEQSQSVASVPRRDEEFSGREVTTAKAEAAQVMHREEAAALTQDREGDGGATDLPEAPEVGQAPRLDGVQFGHVVVRGGDSVSGIALRKYGQASSTILDLLKLANPELKDIDLISVGQTIRLPELGEGFPILTDGSGHYALLVFSTTQGRRASGLQSALLSRGFDAHVLGGSVGFRKPMFRVVLRGFTDRSEVAAVGMKLQKLFREDPRVAQLGE